MVLVGDFFEGCDAGEDLIDAKTTFEKDEDGNERDETKRSEDIKMKYVKRIIEETKKANVSMNCPRGFHT